MQRLRIAKREENLIAMQLSGNKKDKKHGKRKTLSGQRAS
jgi:hypothetical protein|tara:strand:- start:749 stop:868 length:120 start_codon:yes stop_codon:yes gene_type:complete